tara:strand:+ start:431 stop:865 length:435 start_codon:yes stop_codon:yes gene_type:complete
MHLDACFELDQKSFKGLWSISQWERELTDPKRICLGVFHFDSKKLFALCSAWLILDELHITALAVHPNQQRKGLGKFILSSIIKRSKSLKINQIRLEVKETNQAAIALYKSMDFKIKGHRSNFYKDGTKAIIFAMKSEQIIEST